MKHVTFITTLIIITTTIQAQNVGIGTTSPSSTLHLSGGNGPVSLLLEADINNSGEENQPEIIFLQDGAIVKSRLGYLGSTNTFSIMQEYNGNMDFYTDSIVRMTINYAGKVGIGTSTPTVPLDVMGAIHAKFYQGGPLDGSSVELSTPYGNPGIIFRRGDGFGGFVKRWNILVASDKSFRIADHTQIVDRLVIDTIGNIGIGTSHPRFPLSFSNGLGDKIALWGHVGNHYGFGIDTSELQIYTDLVGSDITFGYGSSSSFTEIMRIKGNGRVGIGTDDPTKGLVEILGEGSYGPGSSYGYLNTDGTTGSTTDANPAPYSLWVSHRIGANAINIFSDSRIKLIKGISDGKEDLNTIMDLEITDYRLIDSLAMGRRPQKKIIAQQVAEVFPQAITKTITEVVPDIYRRATVEDGWIICANDLIIGERVKIITECTADLYEVLDSEPNRFRVEIKNEGCEMQTIFVYGREVDDFHTVDYDAIAMLNVSATQEQQRIIEMQEKRISELEVQNEDLKAAHIDIKSELVEIKAMLAASVSN